MRGVSTGIGVRRYSSGFAGFGDWGDWGRLSRYVNLWGECCWRFGRSWFRNGDNSDEGIRKLGSVCGSTERSARRF